MLRFRLTLKYLSAYSFTDLFRILKIELKSTVILLCILCGHENYSVILGVINKSRVSAVGIATGCHALYH
jgi:hypothetical protein